MRQEPGSSRRHAAINRVLGSVDLMERLTATGALSTRNIMALASTSKVPRNSMRVLLGNQGTVLYSGKRRVYGNTAQGRALVRVPDTIPANDKVRATKIQQVTTATPRAELVTTLMTRARFMQPSRPKIARVLVELEELERGMRLAKDMAVADVSTFIAWYRDWSTRWASRRSRSRQARETKQMQLELQRYLQTLTSRALYLVLYVFVSVKVPIYWDADQSIY